MEEGAPSGGNGLDVVGGVEADLAAAQLSFTPALLVLLTQLQQLLAWKERRGRKEHSDIHRRVQTGGPLSRFIRDLVPVQTKLS